MKPQRAIALAALDVLASISEENLRAGTSPTACVSRARLMELREAVERAYPGTLARMREIIRGD